MAEQHASKGHRHAEPPGRGRQDHDTMHAAATHLVTGPASTDTLAAGGGLDVPGREAHPLSLGGATSPAEIIPGERDASTLTHREPGALGSQFSGADVPAPDTATWLDDDTATERTLEGGGDVAKPLRRSISGPGAADFLTASGGVDVPESGSSKGMAHMRGEGPLADAKGLVPRLGPDTEAFPGERESGAASSAEGGRDERRPEDRLTGSQTGTIGGGGADAHNPSPVRATGVDDPTVRSGSDESKSG